MHSRGALLKEFAVGFGFLLQRQRVGAGGGGHAPEAERCPVGAGHDGRVVTQHDDVNPSSHWRDGATEGLGDDAAGFFAGGDKGVALRNTGQEGGDVGGSDHLQEGVGGIVAETSDLGGSVVEGQAGLGAELPNRSLVKPLLPRHAEMQLVPKVN